MSVQQRKKNDFSPHVESGGSSDALDGSSTKGPGRPRRRRRIARAGNDWLLKFGLMTLVVLTASYFLVSKHEKVQMEHLRDDIIHDKVEPLSREWEEKYAKLKEENEELKKGADDNASFLATKEQLEKQLLEGEQQLEEQENHIRDFVQYKQKMKSNIQLMSKISLLEKFGPGPHHVEVKLEFDPEFPKNTETDNDTGRIVIEMAPVEEMPHVVYWFLEQVNRTLYDGCSFHRNAGHVIQGGPAPNFLSPPNPKLNKRFVDSGFHSVLFQEYSPHFEHKKYTLGFAGRPGGPDFYISTMDNSKLHGPGGQTSYEDSTEADPCFAKVVEGYDVVDRMSRSPVKPGNYKAMVNNVAIVSMKLMQKEEVLENVENVENVEEAVVEKAQDEVDQDIGRTLEEPIEKLDKKIVEGEKFDGVSSGDFMTLLTEKRKKRIGKKGGFGNVK